MEFEAILKLLKDYDLPTIGLGFMLYLHFNKKLNTVDKAVNQRPVGEMTISQEVTEIHRKIDVANVRTEYITKEIEAHRQEDEKLFVEITKDIKGIHKRISQLATKS